MEENKKSFIEELQELSEPMKKKVLIVSTVVIMLVVLYVWAFYFNSLVTSVAPPDATLAQNQTATTTPPVPGFWDNAGNGMAYIFDEFAKGFQGIGNVFKGPTSYTVQPK